MIAAHEPVQRPLDARLLVVDGEGCITHAPRSRLINFLQPGDLVIANDAATLPASLYGVHLPSGAAIEVRLAGRSSLAAIDVHAFSAIVFGAGDFHTRTEDRPLPPALSPGDRFVLGPLSATIEALLDHPRLVRLRFAGSPREVWAGLARHGRPIQYAHMPTPLALWDVWTPIAGLPVAFEPPSAGFALDWKSIRAMRERGIAFATITLAAGISSTGDTELDRRLPFDEPYRIPTTTASAIQRVRSQGGRIVAIGTTVVRALEHAAAHDGVIRAGDGTADQRMGPTSRLRVVEAILSGTHERGSSHYELLRAFLDDATLGDADAALELGGYRTHEFGDSVLIERTADRKDAHRSLDGRLAALIGRAQACRPEIHAHQLTVPPATGSPTLVPGRESVFVVQRAHVARSVIGKRIRPQKTERRPIAFEQFDDQGREPRVL
jgi:S-adenosylmethionine:tRNA ribosyltransferase-isomerase